METPHILIADDDQSLRTVIAETFRIAGYEVNVAADGAEALALCVDLNPDAVVLDVGMPRMNGFEVCRELRHLSQFANLPIVLLTARAGETDRHWGIDAGADEYLTKPFDPATLIAAVSGLLEAQRRGEERNPLTKLPDLGSTARRAAEEAKRLGVPAASVVLELTTEPAAIYRQKYGDLALAKAILLVADCLRDAVAAAGSPGGVRVPLVLGHAGDVGYSRFLLAGAPPAVQAAVERAHRAFMARVAELYDSVDQRRGHVAMRKADGTAVQVPFLTLHAERIPLATLIGEPRPAEGERLAA
jgi:DNA-binding response OmpR family regulator